MHLGKVRVDLRKAGISMTEGIDEWINGFIRLPWHPSPHNIKTKMKGITMTTMHDDDGNEYDDDDNDGDDDDHDMYGHEHDSHEHRWQPGGPQRLLGRYPDGI